MTAIVTIRINCDGRCGNFRVVETSSVTSARRMLQPLGWRVVLKPAAPNGNARPYGDRCPECPQEDNENIPWRYSGRERYKTTAAAVIGDALPRRKKE